MRLCLALILVVATFIVGYVSSIDVDQHSARDLNNERTKDNQLRVEGNIQEERMANAADVADTISKQVTSLTERATQEKAWLEEGGNVRPRTFCEHFAGGLLALLTAAILIGGGIAAVALRSK
uniref:Uncharacterized protein n=1 Tax=Peronospora matthiolae TaxID=2874970 RepID=A0AAV1VBM3_9STRA